MLQAQQVTAVHVFCSDFHERSSRALTPTSLVRLSIDQLFEKRPALPYHGGANFSPRRIRACAQTLFGVWDIFERLMLARSGEALIVIDRIEFLADDDGDDYDDTTRSGRMIRD